MMAPPDKIKVLIVDDHQVVRQGLRTFLELHDDVVVVGEAGDGLTAVELARQLEPDVVLMDLVMPQLDGIAATRQVKSHRASVKVIALTSFTEDDKVFPAIQAGASSYLLKDVSPDELVEAIRAVHRGEARLHPDIVRKLMDAMRVTHQAGPLRETPAPTADLTGREREVICLVARGCNNHEIAQKLVISDKTVKTHVSNILSKLDLEDRTQLAIYAIKHGLADSD
jgi:NarL family two-component system response regulator LiaR